jgi:ABC-2 type transport system permease protein
MQKIWKHKYGIWVLTALFIAVVYLSTLWFYRVDLTAEKRYSLTPATKTLLKEVDSIITIRVFLTGELPADYKKLSIATKDLLDEFRSLSGNHIQVIFEKPGEDIKDDSAKTIVYEKLQKLGVVFERSEIISSKSGKETNQLIIPSALVSFRNNQKPIAIDLRSSRKIFKQFDVKGNQQEDVEATRNAAEALLEFKFADAIDKLTRKNIPTLAYLVGNGEPTDLKVNDLGEILRNEYRLAVFDLKTGYPDPDVINALIVVKPTQTFTDNDKLKLDQFVMNGGRIIWFIDRLHAELDSLMRTQSAGQYTAFDRELGLDELFFRYGVRINPDLVQDLNCSKIPIVIGTESDGSPRIQRFPWPYYPFLSNRSNNPITKNMDRVLPIFPSSIDTVKTPGITKTILLATDTNSRRISSPTIVTLKAIESGNNEESIEFNKSYIPVAVLLEGKFRSLYSNRIGKNLMDSVQIISGKPYRSSGVKDSKQIVVSDGDIVTNLFSSTTGPLPMGMLPLENYRFANREFLLNSVDYLVNTNNLFESRNKDFVLRLLDKAKVEEQRTTWQLINIVVPIILVILTGIVFQWKRRRYNR